MKFNKNEFGWKEKVSVNTNLNNDTFNIKFLPDMNISSKVYVANIVDLEENTTYRVNMNLNKKLSIRYYFSDGTFKSLYSLASKYLLGKVEIYIYRKTDTLIEFDVDNDKYIRYTCNIDEANKTVEITKKALILNTDNKQEYTPTLDYHPATKKYVDDKFVMNENIETIYTIPMSEMQKCNNGTSRYVSNIDFDELFINHEKNIYYANYKDDTLIPVKYDSKYNRFTTDVLDKTSDYNIILGFDLGTHRMYPFNSGSTGVKAYTFTNDLIIKRVPILNVNEVATREYVDDSVNTVSENNIFKNTQMNNMLSSLTIGGLLSTGLTKSKTLGEVFPKLLNEEYGVLKQCYVTVEVDGTTKPILTENYNNVLIQLYDNDNNLISSTSLRPKKVGTIYFNANEFMQMAVWFDATYTEESGLSHNTPGYVTSLLNISASKNTEEYINAIKDLRISVTLRHTNYLPKDNTVMYEPTSDYHPATKKYVDDNDKRMLEYIYNGKILKITLTNEQYGNFLNLQSGEYIVLDSISPEDIYKFTSDDSIDWCGCILINNISFNVDLVGNLQIGTINSDNAIKIYTENTYYNSSTLAGIFRYNFSLAVLDNTEQVVLVKCDDVEYHYASTEYINNILSFNESGELVVTINGISKTFVPKPK